MAKIVHTILFGEDIDSSRQVYIDNCVCQLFLIRHDDNNVATQLADDLDRPAVYMLLNRETKQAYIGQTDSFKKRLQQHWSKTFWTEALCFQANDNSLHLTSIHYLEAIAYELAKKVGNYDLSANNQVPTKPTTTPQHRIPAEQFFEYVQFLTRFVGCDIFSGKVSKKEQAADGQHLFYCTRGGSNAKGYMEDNEQFVVLGGSVLRSGECDSFSAQWREKRQEFINTYCMLKNGKIVLKADYTFTSPSTAAVMIVGGNSNGWTRWRDAESKTLKEVYRSEYQAITTSASAPKSHPVRQQFWEGFIALNKERNGIFKDNIADAVCAIGTSIDGIRGVKVGVILGRKDCRAEVYINTGNKAKNKAIFDALYSLNDEIKAELPDIVWQRLDNKNSSRIRIDRPYSYLDKKNWDKIYDFFYAKSEKMMEIFQKASVRLHLK